MRVCVVYDCLYPYTVGGAERWYRGLAQHLADEGHSVTYLTLRQWPAGELPVLPGVEVRAVGPRVRLYAGGRRRILPPLLFGAGVFVHLLTHGRRYDVVHTASFPYFSLLAAAAARRLHRYKLFVDWFEVWTREYWRDYLGPVSGWIGWRVQRACVRTRHEGFCFSSLHVRRLREEGSQNEVRLLEGLFAGKLEPAPPGAAEPLVVFAGRYIPEKRVPAIVPAVALARERIPELHATLFGDGPQREEVLRLIVEHGLSSVVEAPGFVDAARVDATLSRALCLVLPSRREGYGLIVVEAAAKGTPSVVVAGPDNAATELVEDGVNGVVVSSVDADELAAAIVRIHEAGAELRASTVSWFRRNAGRISIEGSVERVLGAYRG
jgi:glycosyltransferase involved in cell wall biosynthesis